MLKFERWRQQNQAYLDKSVTWLRQQLSWHILERSPTQTSAADREAHKAKIAEAKAAMDKAQAMEPPPALVSLAELFDLSPFEQSILLLCAAMELDPDMADLCADAQQSIPERPYPTFALALALFDDEDRDAFSPDAPLRYWQLIEINQPPAQPLFTSALRIDEHIFNHLRGLNSVCGAEFL